MADTKLQIIVDAEDRASATIKGINGSLKSMEPAFKKMALAGTVAFGAITAIGITSIKAYQEAERSTRQLEHAILDISKGTREQVEAIDSLSKSLQKKVGIDGDALKAGAAQLSTFGLQSKSVVALTKSLADLTVNQNGISASSDQYVQSANMIAKALNGQFGILEKSGIRFTEAQKHIIEFGTESEKVAAVTAGLNQNLRETTDTLAGSGEAAIARATQAYGELQESIGKALAPALASLMEKLTPVIVRFGEWAEKNPDLLAKILLVAGAVAGLVAVVGFLGLALPAIITGVTLLGAALVFLTGPIGLVILATAALVAGGIALYKNWDKVKQFLSDTWEGIKIIFRESIDKVLGWLKPLTDVIGAVISGAKSVGGAVSTGFKNSMNFIGVKDAIISPRGDIITTDPQDYLIATKTPGGLGGGTYNFHFHDVVAGDDGVRRIIRDTIEKLNRTSTLRGMAGA